LERAKRINMSTLLEEIEGFDSETKEKLLRLFDFIYNELNWPHQKMPRNKVALYGKVEEILRHD